MTEFRVPRRIVTGHDERGRAVIVSDGPVAVTQVLPEDGVAFHEVWKTEESPARITRTAGDPFEGSITVAPPANGTRIRINEFKPHSLDEHRLQSPFHTTESIDYGIVLEGEITLILDDGVEVVARAGDIVVQRGTNHAWANRSDQMTRVAFILVAGEFQDDVLEVRPDARDHVMTRGPRD